MKRKFDTDGTQIEYFLEQVKLEERTLNAIGESFDFLNLWDYPSISYHDTFPRLRVMTQVRNMGRGSLSVELRNRLELEMKFVIKEIIKDHEGHYWDEGIEVYFMCM